MRRSRVGLSKWGFRQLAWVLICTVMLTACSSGSGGTPAASGGDAGSAPNEESASGGTTFENKELNIAVFEGGYGSEYWKAVIERFEADYPGVKVNMTSNPKIMDIIKPQLVAGNPPDFIYVSPDENTGTIKALVKEGALMELNDVFDGPALDSDRPLKDKLTDGLMAYMQPNGDGNIYYAPNYMSVLGMWYNKHLFETKGWEVPVTWEDFFALGEVAKAEGRALYTYQGIYPSYNESVFWPAVASAGGLEAMNKALSYEEGGFTQDAVKQVMGVFERMAQNDDVMKGTVALNHTQAQTEFLKGGALFIPNGSWFESEMADAPREEGFEFGFLGVPVFSEGDQAYVLSSFEAMYIPNKAKNPELAKEFLRYQYNDDIVQLNAEKSKGVMAVKGAVELAKDYIPASAYEAFKVYDEGALPMMVQWKQTPKSEVIINDELFNPLGDVMNKKMTADQWADKVEQASAKLRNLLNQS
ncbi:carbohydrate ABC transporter substrate-binding protein [Paenibacillus campinasensis]|uniref:Carbohydrate ABC transporter substrate-binding protein n=1 Tax=Paenibacillus campinasensis TaxID=66347 RepID=A0A268EK08_9BACL|nr:carbohydrate ABC transporter substrate-binding protein [Paenibacillus campinasensis]PAD73414.1 carbohydrate ABC transporter substrate-binding protein [Paenibacillus campinasensis]